MVVYCVQRCQSNIPCWSVKAQSCHRAKRSQMEEWVGQTLHVTFNLSKEGGEATMNPTRFKPPNTSNGLPTRHCGHGPASAVRFRTCRSAFTLFLFFASPPHTTLVSFFTTTFAFLLCFHPALAAPSVPCATCLGRMRNFCQSDVKCLHCTSKEIGCEVQVAVFELNPKKMPNEPANPHAFMRSFCTFVDRNSAMGRLG
jgi:hypothetical protein